jgi:hypothetical protein
MTTLAVYDMGNKKVSDLEVDDRIFGAEVNPSLFHEAVQPSGLWRRGRRDEDQIMRPRRRPNPGDRRGRGEPCGISKIPVWRGGGTMFAHADTTFLFLHSRRGPRWRRRWPQASGREADPGGRFTVGRVQDAADDRDIENLQVKKRPHRDRQAEYFLERSA